MEYLEETKKSMEWLAKKKDTIFLGQTTCYEGSAMYRSLKDVDINKKIEMPVAEDMQMGMSIGLALEGYIPITIFPRMDFLLLAVNQLVNHLDKIKEMSHGEFKAGVIIRTQIGNTKPLYPGVQHCGNYYHGLQILCKNIYVEKLINADTIQWKYRDAYERAKRGVSTLFIETPQGGKSPNKK